MKLLKIIITFILKFLFLIINKLKFDIYIYNIFFMYVPINIFNFFNSSYSGYIKMYKPKKGDIVIEGGAYKGNFTILLSRMVKKEGKVIALEPNPVIYKILKKRIIKLKLKNIILINSGLWWGKKYLKFNTGILKNNKNFNALNNNKYKEKKSVNIKCISIDSIVKKYKLKCVDFISMDIEGTEIEAIKGAYQTLKKFPINIAIASYHIRDGEQTYKKVEKLLQKLNYNTITLNPVHLTTYASKITL